MNVIHPPIKAYSWLHKKEVTVYGYHKQANALSLDENTIIFDCTVEKYPMIFRMHELKFDSSECPIEFKFEDGELKFLKN